MRHSDWLDTKCSKCNKSLSWYEDVLSLSKCFYCRQNDGAQICNRDGDIFPLSIQSLIKVAGKPWETRTVSPAGKKVYFDVYRLESRVRILFFAVIRGSYERITWLTQGEAVNFLGNTVIDEILKEEKISKENK